MQTPAEFYPKGNLPAKLRRDIDTNSALIAAQTQAIENQKFEQAAKLRDQDAQIQHLTDYIQGAPCATFVG